MTDHPRPHKRLDRRGLPVDAPDTGPDGDDARPDAGEASDAGPAPSPAEEVTEPNPTRIGER